MSPGHHSSGQPSHTWWGVGMNTLPQRHVHMMESGCQERTHCGTQKNAARLLRAEAEPGTSGSTWVMPREGPHLAAL